MCFELFGFDFLPTREPGGTSLQMKLLEVNAGPSLSALYDVSLTNDIIQNTFGIVIDPLLDAARAASGAHTHALPPSYTVSPPIPTRDDGWPWAANSFLCVWSSGVEESPLSHRPILTTAHFVSHVCTLMQRAAAEDTE